MGVDLEWERDLLAAVLDHDEEIVRSAAPILKRYDFSDPAHAWIWSLVADTWTAHHEFPTPTAFKASADTLQPDKRDGHLRTLIKLAKRVPQGPLQALETVRRYVAMAAGRTAVMDSYDALNAGKTEDAEQALAEGLLRMRQAQALEEEVSAVDGFDDRMKRYMSDLPMHERTRIRTPLAQIDRWLGGGPYPGAFCLVVSPSGVGKSAYAVDLGHSALTRSSAVVLHLTTEETKTVCAARYDARFSGVSKSRLLGKDALTEIEVERLQRGLLVMKQAGGDRLYVKEIDPGTPVTAVPAIAASIREKHPAAPLVVVIDLIDDLRPVKTSDQGYTNVRDTVIPLVAMALDKRLGRCVVWAMTQAVRKVRRDKGVVSPDQIGEGHDKFKKSTIVLSLYEAQSQDDGEDSDDPPSEKDEGIKLLGIRLIKNRLGMVNSGTATASVDLGCSKFVEAETAVAAEDDGGTDDEEDP